MLNAQVLRELPADEVESALSQLSPLQLEHLHHDWNFWARPNQLAPDGDWNTWFIQAGRGFGKTRAGVEWVREQVKQGHKRIAAVAATNSDIERVMVKGESGFLNTCWAGDKTHKGKELGLPEWSPTKRSLTWANGAKVESQQLGVMSLQLGIRTLTLGTCFNSRCVLVSTLKCVSLLPLSLLNLFVSW